MSEILNIISSVPSSGKKTGGPNKVFYNTIKGLENIGQPYVLNKDLRYYRWNWIHDSREGLIEAALKKIPAVVGPNIATLPSDLPILLPSLKKIIFLHPSFWPIELWKKIGFSKCQLKSWAAGIDVDDFQVSSGKRNNKNVLIYFKRRHPQLLINAVEIIKACGLNPIKIEYGNYSEEEYKKALKDCSFGIWIGVSESQGIGLLEALASDLPLIVLDVKNIYDSYGVNDYIFPKGLENVYVTSAPYFDKSCGLKINKLDQLPVSIQEMRDNFDLYLPSKFVTKYFGLGRQAASILEIFKSQEFLIHTNIYSASLKFVNNRTNFRLSMRGFLIYLVYRLGRFVINKKKIVLLNGKKNF